eukprot:m.126191 g.126191  ORF g.126191 m.126191 type:complete len:388 (-) comp29185_c0_seq1:18-1181(-)
MALTINFTTVLLALAGVVAVALSDCETPGGELTSITGYPMDNFCIKRGTLLDNGAVRTLEEPFKHSIHCLIDVGICWQSGFAILKPPSTKGDLYSVGSQLDMDGTKLVMATGERERQLRIDAGHSKPYLDWQVTVSGYFNGTHLTCVVIGLPPSTEPATDSTEPTTDSTEPTTDSTEPATDPTEPTTDSTEPTTDSTEPTTDSTEPTTGSTEPTTDSTESTTDSTEPATDSTESATDSTKPTSTDSNVVTEPTSEPASTDSAVVTEPTSNETLSTDATSNETMSTDAMSNETMSNETVTTSPNASTISDNATASVSSPSPTDTTAFPETSSSSGGLTGSATAAIVGVFVTLLVIGGVVAAFFVFRQKKGNSGHIMMQNPVYTDENEV